MRSQHDRRAPPEKEPRGRRPPRAEEHVSRCLLSVLALLAACTTPATPLRVAAPLPPAHPPATAPVPQVDDYHGTSVADPYRWLEDDNSPQTAAWVAAQNAVTQKELAALPQREALRSRLTELWNVPRVSGVRRAGPHYVWSRNDGLQPQEIGRASCRERV